MALECFDFQYSPSSGNQVCRFCLKTSEKSIDLFEDKEGTEALLFLNKYDDDLKIVFHDSWPRIVCLNCLNIIFNFRKLCETVRENENKLVDEYSSIKVEENDVSTFLEDFEEIPVTVKTEDNLEDAPGKQEKHDDQMISEFFSLTCDLCQTPFKRASDLRLHFRRHHKRRWYIVCCRVKHRQKGRIMEHLMYHTNPNKFKCSHCRRQFMTQIALSNHIENRHNPEKRVLECGFCEKIFAIKSILKLHIRKQHMRNACKTLAKPRPPSIQPMKCICEVCGKVFNEVKKLRRHAKAHNPAEDPSTTQPAVRKFKCNQCGCAYKQRQTLRAHEKKHNAYGTYKCEHCGKISPTPTALQKHIKDSHTLQRDFVCHICYRGFKRKTVLKEHIAIHTGEYLYSCDFCSKQFRAGANKSLHMRREHPEHRGNFPKT